MPLNIVDTVRISESYLDELAHRFCAWKLPQYFRPDCYIEFDAEKARRQNSWPTGTNLLTVDQARDMLREVLQGRSLPPLAEENGVCSPETIAGSNPPEARSELTGSRGNEMSSQILQRLGTDARAWAQEFASTTANMSVDEIRDVGLMIGWFASAIMHAKDTLRWDLTDWAVQRWNAEVRDRPLHNVHRRSLDDVWRQIILQLGSNPYSLIGPAHDELLRMSRVDPSTRDGDGEPGNAEPSAAPAVNSVSAALGLLGHRMRDRITGLTGVATSVSFDLYGCVQAAINPGLDSNGKQREVFWFDTNRLERTGEDRVMEPPDFNNRLINHPSQFDHGAAEKPAPSSP